VQAVTIVNSVMQVPDMEATAVEFDMRSNRSMSSSFYFSRSGARTDRLGRDPAEVSMNSMRSFRAVDNTDVVKQDQKKLRKALERAVRQERKEARKMKKITEKADRSSRRRSSSSKRIALLSAGTASDCSVTSDQEILAEIWAKRSPSLCCMDVDDMPEVDGDLADTAPMEFLFFTGCPDDKSLRELDVGNRRLRSNPRAARYPAAPSYATSVPTKPTLVSHMPPVFAPRFNVVLG
jgi:hypothetical protein